MSDVDTSNWSPGTHYYTQVTPENKAGWLYIITLLSLCYILIVCAVRFVVKIGLYGRDDWALLGSTILAMGQHAAVLVGMSHGLGKSVGLLHGDQLEQIEKYTSAHIFLFFLSHCASKLSIALLTQRLFQNGRRRNRWFCWGLVAVSAFYGLWAVLTESVGCDAPAFPVASVDRCPNRYLRFQLITAIDVATEFILVIVPMLLVMDVQMKMSTKALIVTIFAVRLPVVAFSVLNLRSIRNPEFHRDAGLAIVPPLIWTQAELLWSIVAASVPCLKSFLKPFDKVNESEWRSGNMYSSQHSYRSAGGKDFELADMQRRNSLKPGFTTEGAVGRIRPDKVGHDTVIQAMDDSVEEEESARGSQERIIKKHTEWEVTVDGISRDPYAIP